MQIAKVKKTSLLSPFNSTDFTMTLVDFVDHKGNTLTLANFDSLFVLTIRQGTVIEMVLCNNIVQNADGSATITVQASTGRQLSAILPYTGGATGEDFGAGAEVVNGNDPYTMYQIITIYADALAIAGAPDSDYTVKGILERPTQAEVDARTVTGSTTAPLTVTPDTLRAVKTHDYVADTGTADTYAIAPVPAVTAYATGQIFTFKAVNANTGTSTLDVATLGAKTIQRQGRSLISGNIVANQIIQVMYDGTNFQLISVIQNPTERSITAGETVNGATLPVPVYQNKTDNEFYACDANDNTKYKYLGFSVSDGTNGTSMSVKFSGIVGGFSGLSEGEKYYVQDAVGTIGTAVGTQEILVGIAISTTELLIQKGKRYASGVTDISSVTASGTEVITLGFRPSRIRINGGAQNSVASLDSSTMDAVWENGSIVASALLTSISSASTILPRIYDTSLVFLEFSITNVTDTGFTITYTETGAFSVVQGSYKWEAEGEL